VIKSSFLLRTGRIVAVGLGAMLSASFVMADDPGTFDQPLLNGNFSDGLAEWTLEFPDEAAVPPPSVSVLSDSARIARGGAYVPGLSQEFSAPEGLRAIKFRLTEMPVLTADGSFIPDAFDVDVTSPGRHGSIGHHSSRCVGCRQRGGRSVRDQSIGRRHAGR
jgi:hypothetical protein